jgi:hypothetical protein
MKGILKYFLIFILAVGIVFLTTDCEIYFAEINHHLTTQTSPVEKSGDVEHTHVSHHMVNDLISETKNSNFQKETLITLLKSLSLPSFKITFFTSIFQPPKFSRYNV